MQAHIKVPAKDAKLPIHTGVRTRLARRSIMAGGKGALGWVAFIGILLLVNLLSYIFDWSFWLY
jgi:hypothetical protein